MPTLDPYGYQVGLLVHADGINGENFFTDESLDALTLSVIGSVTTSTARSKFGGASALFTGGGRISIPSTPSIDIGTGDFTIEGWFYATDLSAMNGLMGTGAWWLIANASTIQFQGSSFSTVTVTTTVPTNTWFHLALSRVSGVLYVFKDGALVGSPAFTGSMAQGNIVLGSANPSNSYGMTFEGNMDDVRITVCRGRYTTGFTAPIEAYPDPEPVILGIAMGPSQPTMQAFGGGSLELSRQQGRMSAAGGAQMAMTLTKGRMYAVGHDSTGENAISMAASKGSMAASTGASVAMSATKSAMTAVATVTNWAKSAMTAAAGMLAATATVSSMASIAMAAPAGRMSASAGANATMSASKGRMTATATASETARIAMVSSKARMSASATMNGVASIAMAASSGHMGWAGASISMKSAPGRMSAIASAVVAVTYEAYAANLNHTNPNARDEVTRYTNFPFTHVVRYQKNYYGAGPTGLFLLEGTTDNATPIPWSFKTGITDFDDAKQKTVAAAYFGGSMPPATTVTLFEGDKVGVPYAQTTPRGADLQNYRETFARGVKGRYYALGLSGTGDIELDDLDFEIKQLTRRI